MKITKVKIENYKQFDNFSLNLNDQLNILIGDNSSGKSSILEVVNLALTGYYRNQNLKNNLTSEIFNKEKVQEYIESLKTDNKLEPPNIKIELYIEDIDADFMGDLCSEIGDHCGISYKVCFDESYNSHYEEWLNNQSEKKSLPIEFYKIEWQTFNRSNVFPKSLPLKCSLINGTDYIYQNGSSVFVARNIKNNLNNDDQIILSQTYRESLDSFENNNTIKNINTKPEIKNAGIRGKNVAISIHDNNINDWEDVIVVKLNEINYPLLGQGEQSMFKIKLALSHNKQKEKNLILIEEIENHLSVLNLQSFVKEIEDLPTFQDKQIIITSHNNYIINRLNIKNIILLNQMNQITFKDIENETARYFQKLSSLNTLNLILSKKVILCEGPADELIIQKLYLLKYGRLPQEDDVQVICVGTSAKRFIELGKKLTGVKIAVVLDNDEKKDELEAEYATILSDVNNIKLFTGDTDAEWTLEPCLIKSFTDDKLKQILNYNGNDLNTYMKNNKTECALQIFEKEDLTESQFPDYIKKAIEYVKSN